MLSNRVATFSKRHGTLYIRTRQRGDNLINGPHSLPHRMIPAERKCALAKIAVAFGPETQRGEPIKSALFNKKRIDCAQQRRSAQPPPCVAKLFECCRTWAITAPRICAPRIYATSAIYLAKEGACWWTCADLGFISEPGPKITITVLLGVLLDYVGALGPRQICNALCMLGGLR